MVLTAAMVSQFREQGFLVLPRCVPLTAVDMLRAAAINTINRRGFDGQFPGGGSGVHESVTRLAQPSTPRSASKSTTAVALPARPSAKAPESRKGRKRRTIGWKLLQMERTLRHRYNLSTRDMSLVREVDIERIIAVRAAQRQEPNRNAIFDAFFRSPAAQQFVGALSAHERSWFYTWREEAALGEAVAGEFGRLIGEMAAQLLGTLAVRMYSDALTARLPLSGWCPLSVDTRAEHRCVSAVIALTPPTVSSELREPFLHVLPGSHRAIVNAMVSGRVVNIDGSPYSSQPLLQTLPELTAAGRGVSVPYPAAGDILFFNNFLAKSMHPLMASWRQAPPYSKDWGTTLVSTCPTYYTVSIIPDGMVHDGASRGWMTDDPKGPLFGLKKGQIVNDPQAFPLLYRMEGLE